MTELTLTQERQRDAVVAKFNALLGERERLGNALIEREDEAETHELVIKTLEQKEGSRRAFQLVGDVLVESTVAEVLPATQKHRERLVGMVQNLRTQLQAKTAEVQAFQQKYNIKVKDEGGSDGGQAAVPAAAAGSQGVLVSS